MAKAILLVYVNCEAGREDEFNHWYDTIHIPDMLAVDGIITAQRFKLSGPGPQMVNRDGQTAVAQYLALYELDTDDTRGLNKRIGAAMEEVRRSGRNFDGIRGVGSGTYVAISDPVVAPASPVSGVAE